ncbi:unnamed protein product, partial [Polarella glacialis]
AVFVEFGSDRHLQDLLIDGSLQVAAGSTSPAAPFSVTRGQARLEHCGEFKHLLDVRKEKMVYWEEGASSPKNLPVPAVRCIRVAVLK